MDIGLYVYMDDIGGNVDSLRVDVTGHCEEKNGHVVSEIQLFDSTN